MMLSANDRTKEQTFFIVDQDVPATLNGAAAESLGFIYPMRDLQHELYPPVQSFADVFEGLGQLKDFEYDLKLKPDAVGVVVPAKRVPVALQDKVKAELQRMVAQDVIAKVTEPTEWSSHMVTVVKKDKVRIGLNPTALNKVLLRERYPMPTLEDTASKLSGAKYFSTPDVASGF